MYARTEGKERPMRLIEPTIEYFRQIEEYRKEFIDCGSSMDGTGSLIKTEDPEIWISQSILGKKKETAPKGLVPATQYIYVRETDDKIVGMLQIRHCLNDHLEKYGGHIGYSVAPSERRKGYASMMLKEGLARCKELGITKALVTCDDDNEGSRRTILNNGGVYDSTIFEPERNVNIERYWIDIVSEAKK